MAALVSTIIPVFNRGELLKDAVESVLSQTFWPIEIIIVDDGSTDNTPEVIERLIVSAPDIIRSLRQANAGPGVAREYGRRAARGEFIQYLDSDDLLLPRKFELQVAALGSNPESDIAYGKTHFCRVGETLTADAYKDTGIVREFLFPSLLISRWWSTNTPLYRRSLCDRIGSWKGLWNEEDWEYDARAAAMGTKLCYCEEFVSITRSHEPAKHLSFQGDSNPEKLRDRATAHELILSHAWTARIKHNQPEMQHFARELFLLSRQCGAAGLVEESKKLFMLARHASTPERSNGVDFNLYEIAARIFGWRFAGQLSCWSDRWRQ